MQEQIDPGRQRVESTPPQKPRATGSGTTSPLLRNESDTCKAAQGQSAYGWLQPHGQSHSTGTSVTSTTVAIHKPE